MTTVKKSTNNKCWRRCREKVTLLHSWWECKLEQSLWKTEGRFIIKLKTELLSNLAIPLLGIYPEKTIIRKPCSPVLTEALFTIASSRKQLKCPSTREWIKKKWHTCTAEYYSVRTKCHLQQHEWIQTLTYWGKSTSSSVTFSFWDSFSSGNQCLQVALLNFNPSCRWTFSRQ